jgi:two-component system KDP operon response regulator KdpE
LSSAGFQVLTAASGDEALLIAADSPVDVVLLDYSMPGLSPQDTLAGLRRVHPGLPVVCLSGLGMALEGATAQLIKPVSRDQLVETLESALRPR